MFFGNWGIRFFELVGLIVNNMERIKIEKKHNYYSSMFKVLK